MQYKTALLLKVQTSLSQVNAAARVVMNNCFLSVLRSKLKPGLKLVERPLFAICGAFSIDYYHDAAQHAHENTRQRLADATGMLRAMAM